MSRLHDIKKGIVTRTLNVVQKQADNTLEHLAAKLAKEDPEKVKGFLGELANDPTMRPDARAIFKKLLDAANKGENLENVMKEETTDKVDIGMSD